MVNVVIKITVVTSKSAEKKPKKKPYHVNKNQKKRF